MTVFVTFRYCEVGTRELCDFPRVTEIRVKLNDAVGAEEKARKVFGLSPSWRVVEVVTKETR